MRSRICIILLVSLLCNFSSKFVAGAAIVGRPALRTSASKRTHNSFFPKEYIVRDERSKRFKVRQVPGDGACLFHSITAWLTFLQTGQHLDFDVPMRRLSLKLRNLSLAVLQEKSKVLVIEQGEKMEASSLLQMIADHYSIKPEEYCSQLRDPRAWGGGPEIVALSNHFQCPIHVYQLCTQLKDTPNILSRTLSLFSKVHVPLFLRNSVEQESKVAKKKENKEFALELCAKFGSPDFDTKEPISILCADGRYDRYILRCYSCFYIRLIIQFNFGYRGIGFLTLNQENRKTSATTFSRSFLAQAQSFLL
jgi:hypothetical protein